MDYLVNLICNPFKKRHHDYDFMDYINTEIMSYFLFIIGFVWFGKGPFVDSVDCKSNPHWKKSWIFYVQDICSSQSQTFIDPASPPTFDSDNGVFGLIPMFFVLCGGLFYAPRWYWSYVSSKTYHYYPQFCSTAKDYKTHDYFQTCLKLVDEAFYLPRNIVCPYYIQFMFPRCVQKFFDTHYLTICYLSFKFFQIINNIAIHLLLCFILTHDSLGVQSAFIVISGNDWKTTGLFPRTFICGLNIPGVVTYADFQKETTECFLKSNIFYEFVFLVYFIASVCLLIANLVSLFYWIIRLCRSSNFLKTLVKHNSEIDFSLVKNKSVLTMFCQTLSFDTRFVLMMIDFDAAAFSAKFFYSSFIQKNATAKAVLEAPSPEKAKEIFENYLKNSN